ncbi:MAG: diguanylate cyclase [Dehalococcoidales bacterium]
MNIYALIPLIAVVVYIPLLITTISSRPWHTRHKLFILFLIAAMTWSLTDVFLRSNAFPQYNNLLLKFIVITYTWMCVQFYCFVSSFYTPGQGRWLPLAYASLVIAVALVLLGYAAEGVTAEGDRLYLDYGRGTVFIALPLLLVAARMTYVFGKRLRILDNPVLRNQIISLMFSLFVLLISILAAFLPWGREYAVSHFGSIIVASILSYATIRHQLVDIRIFLRRSLAWVSLGIIGAVSYGVLFIILGTALGSKFDLTAIFIATLVAILVAIFIYRLRGYLFITMGKAFQGASYDYRQKLSDFAGKIHNLFSLKEQGGELLTLVTKAIGCKRAYLLFLEAGSQDFTTQFVEPDGKDNPLSNLRLSGQNPIVEYLERERKLLTRESLAILPEFRGLWEQEKEEIKSNEIELFMPLISRDRLIGILALDKKQSGRYSLEDLDLLANVTNQVAVSMEKEYLRERLREREEELSVINRSSAIMASSLDIQEIYGSFIVELKKVVDVNWAAIVLAEENYLRFLALFSEIGSHWKVGERIPLKDTATEWITAHREVVVESDLAQGSRFVTAKYHLKQGIRSIAYLPLIIKGEAIGSFIVASRNPNAYSQRYMMLLEQLASQIAMSIENSRLYAEAEEKARVDELTGLLNRRSMDEVITNEIGRHSRYGGVLSLIIFDLDSFKAFNDRFGHLAGDKILTKIGGITRNTIRSTDQAFRYGGDEFAVLLPNTSIDAANQVAERIRKQVAAKMKTGYIPITASLGLASWPADGIGPSEVIATADAALYQAKREGGNRSYCASGFLLPLNETAVSPGDSEDSETLNAIYALAATVDAKDHYTHSHWKKVKEYVLILAEALELEPPEVSKLETCALLHDIGKIGISEKILSKPGKLTAEEWKAIKAHPQVGVNIVSHARQLAPCIAGILHHHERYDGRGYPQGLKGEKIPLEARILALADAFVAMTSERTYSEALSFEEALEEIKQGAGKQFDPRLVKVFCSAIETTPISPTEEKVRR